MTCGKIGCCDDSPNKHATAHFNEVGHPIIRSAEPGEDWSWCYVEEVAFLTPHADGSGTRTRAAGGRAGPDRARARAARDTRTPASTEIADLGNLASNTFDDELNEGISDELREQLSAIERAEERLADGTYGISVVSGKPIPDERLEIVPTAERLVDEEAR